MPDAPGQDDRLDSWKEIAAYLKRDATTVQRWERREGMPVHRHLHGTLGSVYAFRGELDAWQRARKPAEPAPAAAAIAPGAAPARPARATRRRIGWAVAAAATVVVAVGAVMLARRADYFWVSPLAGAQLRRLTDFEGTERAAAISHDGKLVAFLSDRDGRTDVWVTRVGSGDAYNLTQGRVEELVNPSVRVVDFSPDDALVTFWTRKPGASGDGGIGIWAVPALGGQPRPYLDGAAEFDWSSDGSRLAYHTPAAGDPIFVRDPRRQPAERRIFAAPSGLHAHFPAWSPDGAFIYFVQGSLPDAMDVWRVPSGGGAAERITRHQSRVSHPVLLDGRTLVYLASDADGGPWLYSLDVERRVPHRLSSGVERYTSLSASADGRRLVATLASPRESLWRLSLSANGGAGAAMSRIPLTTGRAFSPRLGPGYLLYVSSSAAGDAIWKLADGTGTGLWAVPGARVVGGPSIAADGRLVAFSARVDGRTRLYVMNADGTRARVVADSLELRDDPAWAPDGTSMAVAAADSGSPRLFAVPLDGRRPARLARNYAVEPLWSPDGRFIVYSGPDIGTTFRLEAVDRDGSPYPLPNVLLTRGARRVRFLPGRRALFVLRGEIDHKDLWLLDLDTGSERRLTNLPRDFDVRDFDVSGDGREAVLYRVQEQSDVVLLDRARR